MVKIKLALLSHSLESSLGENLPDEFSNKKLLLARLLCRLRLASQFIHEVSRTMEGLLEESTL